MKIRVNNLKNEIKINIKQNPQIIIFFKKKKPPEVNQIKFKVIFFFGLIQSHWMKPRNLKRREAGARARKKIMKACVVAAEADAEAEGEREGRRGLEREDESTERGD